MENNTLKKLSLSEKSRLLTGEGYWTSASVAKSGIPSIRFSDGPNGLRPQGDKGDNLGSVKSLPATCFPTHSALACSWNKSLAKDLGKCIGEEACFFGADVLLAPDLNIKRSVLCGRNFEYFSEDPYFNGKLGSAYANGVQSAGAGACLKHFAANNREFGRMVSDSVIDERTLREIYLTAFEIAVKESKPAAVMSAYNMLNGVYCNGNEYLLKDILRGEWGFDGIVVSDWGGTYDRASAVSAGADLEMPPCAFSADEVESAVKEGIISEADVDACAERIIKLAVREKKKVDFSFEEHSAFAGKCAEECVVLLKNDGTLPINRSAKVALIGDFALNPVIQGGGSAKVNPHSALSLYECLKGEIIGCERGYRRKGKNKKLARRAVSLCKRADTVIFCAGLYDGDIEGADREDYSLPVNQTSLLKEISALHKNIIVVLSCGSAVDTDWDKEVNALLFAGLCGQSGARAVADIIRGNVNPSGKLTQTFPKTTDSVPCFKYLSENPYHTPYGEGMDVGYRYFHGKEVKYPFGFGLSYTKFSYENLKADGEGVHFLLKNIGGMRGGEAVQMYIKFPEEANAPSVQLKGFDKIFLGAGESREVFIPFDEYSFRSYDVLKKRWVQVKGEYKIYIGSSSENLLLEGSILKDGEECAAPPDTDNLKASAYSIKRDKKGRVTADLHTPLCELKNAKGWFGRVFARVTLYIVRNNKTVFGSMQYLPLRTMAQFGRMKKSTICGLIHMFNGCFFKGLFTIIKG